MYKLLTQLGSYLPENRLLLQLYYCKSNSQNRTKGHTFNINLLGLCGIQKEVC